MTAKPETAAEVLAGLIEFVPYAQKHPHSRKGYVVGMRQKSTRDEVDERDTYFSKAEVRKLIADRLERALSAQGEAVARPVAWYVFADDEHWATLERNEVDAARDEGLQVRPLVFGDITHPAPARVTEDGVASWQVRTSSGNGMWSEWRDHPHDDRPKVIYLPSDLPHDKPQPHVAEYRPLYAAPARVTVSHQMLEQARRAYSSKCGQGTSKAAMFAALKAALEADHG